MGRYNYGNYDQVQQNMNNQGITANTPTKDPGINSYRPQGNSWQLPFGTPDRIGTFGDDGNLKSQYTVDATKDRPESQLFKNEANRLNNRYQAERGNQQRENFNNQQSGMNMLASSGGLDGGSRERMIQNSNLASGNAMASLSGQHADNMYAARSDDIGRQITADQFNVQNTLGEVNNKYQGDWQTFDTTASAYGAEQLANAYGGGKKGNGNKNPYKGSYDGITKPGPEGFNSVSASSYGAGDGNTTTLKDATNPANWSYNEDDENAYQPWNRW